MKQRKSRKEIEDTHEIDFILAQLKMGVLKAFPEIAPATRQETAGPGCYESEIEDTH